MKVYEWKCCKKITAIRYDKEYCYECFNKIKQNKQQKKTEKQMEEFIKNNLFCGKITQ